MHVLNNLLTEIMIYSDVFPFCVVIIMILLLCTISRHKKKNGSMSGYWGKRGAGPAMIIGLISGVLLLCARHYYNYTPPELEFAPIGVVTPVLIAEVVSLFVGIYKANTEEIDAILTMFLLIPVVIPGFIMLWIGFFFIECEFAIGYILAVIGGLLCLGKGLAVIYALSGKMGNVDTQGSGENVIEKQINQKKVDFYNRCKENGIHSCEKERDVQKATLIAQDMNITYSDIHELYAEAQALQEEKEQREKAKALEEMLAKETAAEKALSRYAHHSGREKRMDILYECWQEAEKAADKLNSDSLSLMVGSQQREKDWAISGGIANGIAGPAAGLAVAMDVQTENARIRAQNRANIDALTPYTRIMDSAAADHRMRAKKYREDYEEAKLKLVAKDSAEECLERLCFYDIKVTVSETGTCKVTGRVSLKEPFCIFDDVKAVIDGTVSADIYDGEDQIGSAPLVLPCYGVGFDRSYVEGLCLSCGKVGKEYTVKFTANNLWAMEQ